jgi:sRNA-binding carbon storage regulator CsrA
MLTLTRERGQTTTITVPPSTEPTVIGVRYVDLDEGGRVRLGFSAPHSVGIQRNEAKHKRSAVDAEVTPSPPRSL